MTTSRAPRPTTSRPGSMSSLFTAGSTAMVTTMIGRRHTSRPVMCAAIDDERVSFLVSREAAWVKAVEGKEALVHVTLADDTRGHYASLNGRATPDHDAATRHRLWTRHVHAAFFDRDDPTVTAVHFDVTDGEVWDTPTGLGTPVVVPGRAQPGHDPTDRSPLVD